MRFRGGRFTAVATRSAEESREHSRNQRSGSLARRTTTSCELTFTLIASKNTATINTMRRQPNQLCFTDHLRHTGWGGPREGAGRKPASRRPPVHHVRRDPVPGHAPAHVTLRVRRGLPSLRSRWFLRVFRSSLRQACERGDFRVVHYSVQRDHVHLLVEAAGKVAMGRGMKSVAPRLARVANRVFRRSGPVLHGRYHIRMLRTPREVRNALAYVLLNARKHWKQAHGLAPPVRIDAASSGRWFDGWKRGSPGSPPREVREVAPPRTWLLCAGWRRHGLIALGEVPGSAS
jgi:REP element-mobilizing transposase RayT